MSRQRLQTKNTSSVSPMIRNIQQNLACEGTNSSQKSTCKKDTTPAKSLSKATPRTADGIVASNINQWKRRSRGDISEVSVKDYHLKNGSKPSVSRNGPNATSQVKTSSRFEKSVQPASKATPSLPTITTATTRSAVAAAKRTFSTPQKATSLVSKAASSPPLSPTSQLQPEARFTKSVKTPTRTAGKVPPTSGVSESATKSTFSSPQKSTSSLVSKVSSSPPSSLTSHVKSDAKFTKSVNTPTRLAGKVTPVTRVTVSAAKKTFSSPPISASSSPPTSPTRQLQSGARFTKSAKTPARVAGKVTSTSRVTESAAKRTPSAPSKSTSSLVSSSSPLLGSSSSPSSSSSSLSSSKSSPSSRPPSSTSSSLTAAASKAVPVEKAKPTIQTQEKEPTKQDSSPTVENDKLRPISRTNVTAMTVAPPKPPGEDYIATDDISVEKSNSSDFISTSAGSNMENSDHQRGQIKSPRVIKSLFPDSTPDNKIPNKSSTKMPPPVLPPKINRPKLQRQHESMHDDIDNDSKSEAHDDELDGGDKAESVDENSNSTSATSIRQSRSLDDLDKASVLSPMHCISADTLEKVRLRRNKSTEKSSLRSSFKGSKPVELIKKYIGGTNAELEVKNEGDSSPKQSTKQRNRWSIGENLKANFEHLKGRISGEIDGISKKKLKMLMKKDKKSASLPSQVQPPTKKTIQKLVGGSSSDISTDEDCNVALEGSSSDSAAADEDVGDDDYDWDEDEFTDEEEDDPPEISPNRSSCYENVDFTDRKASAQKRRQIMEEIVSTETNYVNKLYMLNKTAWEITGANLINEMFTQTVIHQMFPNIEALYRLHGENILPALKQRLEDWSDKPEMAGLWKKYLPFLTMYKSYTSQYDWALDLIIQHKKTSPDFASCLNRIEEKTEFGKLSLEHHLLEPVQRIARYKLLMQNYCKLLSPSDAEKKTATEIVDAFDKLLEACQSQLKQKDMFGDICKLQERFETTLSMLSPTAQILTEGAVSQIKGKSSKKKTRRHLFLFTECLLLCSKRPSGKYRIIQQMELQDLKIRPVESACAVNYGSEKTMLLKEKDESIILYFKEVQKKDEWEERILDAISVKMMERKLRRDGSKGD